MGMEENKCVCILTAGKGSRLNERTEYFNKALLRVGNKAVISHTIDKFPNSTDFVIVLGYKGDIVKQYLELAHPKKKFTFVWTEKYSEAGAGPGYAMLQAKEHLQRPFFYVACDSIIDWKPYKSDWEYTTKYSWVHISSVPQDKVSDYCTVSIVNNRVKNYYNKQKNGTTTAFTGVAYIVEYEEFWTRLSRLADSEGGEIPNAPAFLEMDNIHTVSSEWFDTGTEKGLLEARRNFVGINNLDKIDEELYVVGNSVIKYFHNENMVKHRMQRLEHLKFTPNMQGHTKNFYKYQFVPGSDLFKLKRPQDVLGMVLEQTQIHLWSDIKQLNDLESKIFKDVCKKFYYDKTLSRLDKLYKKLNLEDKHSPLKSSFRRINWDFLSEGVPAKFHGDFNMSNIVWFSADMVMGHTLLDWRQDFGGSIEYGDVYYDLAKMYHSFLFPHPSVKAGKYYIKKQKDGRIKTFIEIPYEIERCKDIFEEFVVNQGYDLWKVQVLTGIVLLNMSPLHEPPIDEYLYYFARDYLEKVLNG
jgi:NDP-sugar pyrophosphorylase family protein